MATSGCITMKVVDLNVRKMCLVFNTVSVYSNEMASFLYIDVFHYPCYPWINDADHQMRTAQ